MTPVFQINLDAGVFLLQESRGVSSDALVVEPKDRV